MRKLVYAAAALTAIPLLTMTPWFFGARRGQKLHSDAPDGVTPPLRFPPGFLFGTATASFQIERADASDWTAFIEDALKGGRFDSMGPGQARPGHIRDLGRYPHDVIDRKTNHDELFDDDLRQAAAYGHNAYRFSVSWARLFPREDMTEPDAEAVAFYQRLLKSVRAHGLQPSLTLFHFASPAWLWTERAGRRGWERADALQHWDRFVRAVVGLFGGEVRHWCTLNEPMVYLYNGYLEGTMPPGERRGDPAKLGPILAQLARAHAAAYHIIKEDARRRGVSSEVGLTQHTRAFEPLRNYAPLDRVTAQLIAQSFIWDLPDALQSGVLNLKLTGFREEIPGLRGTQDYVGINYYGRFYVKSDLLRPARFQVLPSDPARPDEEKNELGWAAYPRGFGQVLDESHRRYRLPIYVLENGTADSQDDDQLRQRFLIAHLRELWLARRRGADIRGYFHWSLIDNFEWAEGFEGRFGLIKVDFLHNFRRSPRPSAALYAQIIREGLSAELLRRIGLP